MKQDKKILSLIKSGLSSATLSELTEGQINSLYSRLLKEKLETKEQSTSPQNTTVTNKTVTQYTVKPGAKTMINGMEIDTSGGQTTVTPIKETDDTEEDNQFTQSSKFSSGEDPQQDVPQDEGPSDNMNADDGMGMFEQNLEETFESKKQQKYFFAKCGDGKTKEQKKWCKMAKEFADKTKNFKKLPEKKTETTEEFTYKDYFTKLASVNSSALGSKVNDSFRPTFESKLEENIINMIHKHTSPKMSKIDFLRTILEAEKEKEVETPVKPDIEKEPKKDNPYQPKHKPAPRAKEKEVQAPPKPDVKPNKPTPATPYQPKHKPAPRAGKLPNWLSFKSIGINLK